MLDPIRFARSRVEDASGLLGILAAAFFALSAILALAGSEELLALIFLGKPPRSPSGAWASMAFVCVAMFLARIMKSTQNPKEWEAESPLSWWFAGGGALVVALTIGEVGPRGYTDFMERVLPRALLALSAFAVLVALPLSAFLRSHRIDEKRSRLAQRRAAGLEPEPPTELRLESFTRDGKWIVLDRDLTPERVAKRVQELLAAGKEQHEHLRLRWVSVEAQ